MARSHTTLKIVFLLMDQGNHFIFPYKPACMLQWSAEALLGPASCDNFCLVKQTYIWVGFMVAYEFPQTHGSCEAGLSMRIEKLTGRAKKRGIGFSMHDDSCWDPLTPVCSPFAALPTPCSRPPPNLSLPADNLPRSVEPPGTTSVHITLLAICGSSLETQNGSPTFAQLQRTLSGQNAAGTKPVRLGPTIQFSAEHWQ